MGAQPQATADRAPQRSRRRARKREPREKSYSVSPTKVILSAGALASAIGSILALTGTVGSFFADGPEGKVRLLKIQNVLPQTFGQYVTEEGGRASAFPAAQRGLHGQLITYTVETENFKKNARLPVRLLVREESSGRITPIQADPIRARHGTDCGCSDWVPTPNPRARYRIGIKIFPPNGTEGSPLRQAWTGVVRGA
jgi:hypothetical protein